jgi:carboxyl-terminal processing protease
VGLVLGLQVRDVLSSSDQVEQLRKIEEAYQYITRSYVEQVDSAQLAEDAIEGMLAGLDPHSIYISAREMRDVRESFNASFEGIGIYYEFVPGREGRDTLVVLMPIAGGPSDEAGLQAGDRILQIDDTTAIGFNQELVQRHLKGPKGSLVTLQIQRPGYRGTLSYTITRDQIPLNTVIASYMIDDRTGYIRLQRFARSSSEEIRSAIDDLRAQGMRQLVFDLRDNAGGLLDQAFEIADEFLPAGDMIVYTESRHANNRRQYRATSGGHFEQDPVIILLNENAASASEIVAGALQDHDRALLVGRRSFGKGLVQQQFPMTDGSVLQMTVSRYFTPSGRLIQTPYQTGGGEEAYFEAKVALREAVEDQVAPNGGMVNARAFGADVPDSLIFRTDGGRTVYGGGGILPDYLVPLDSIPKVLQVVIGKGLDNDFARVHMERLGDRFRAEWRGREREFARQYRLDDAAFRSFLAFAETKGVRVVDVADDPADRDVIVRSEAAESRREIEIRVRAFMARRLYDASSFYPIIGEMDPVLQAALQQWPSATSLAARGR